MEVQRSATEAIFEKTMPKRSGDAINPGLKEVITALPIIGENMRGSGFSRKKVGQGKATNCNGEEVAPHLVVRIFDIESDRNKCFDVVNGVCEVEGRWGDITGGGGGDRSLQVGRCHGGMARV